MKTYQFVKLDKSQHYCHCIDDCANMYFLCFSPSKILATEHEHCFQIYESLPRRKSAIPGSAAMAAAFATYLGPYDHNFRRAMLTIHWPMCLRERGVPLVIDSIDPMKGENLSKLHCV